MSKYILHWEVEDGYAGRSRPQETEFDSDDVMEQQEWDKLSESEKQEFLNDAVQEDYDIEISWYINEIEKL